MTGGTGLQKGFGLETMIRRTFLFPVILIDNYSGEQKMFLYKIVLENQEKSSWNFFSKILVCFFVIIIVLMVTKTNRK